MDRSKPLLLYLYLSFRTINQKIEHIDGTKTWMARFVGEPWDHHHDPNSALLSTRLIIKWRPLYSVQTYDGLFVSKEITTEITIRELSYLSVTFVKNMQFKCYFSEDIYSKLIILSITVENISFWHFHTWLTIFPVIATRYYWMLKLSVQK